MFLIFWKTQKTVCCIYRNLGFVEGFTRLDGPSPVMPWTTPDRNASGDDGGGACRLVEIARASSDKPMSARVAGSKRQYLIARGGAALPCLSSTLSVCTRCGGRDASNSKGRERAA